MASLQHRSIQPEILDSLPPDHPAVLENRRDLLRLNRLMGSFTWMETQLRQCANGGDAIVELGAGDGSLALHIDRMLPESQFQWTGLDWCPAPPSWPARWRWIREDLLHHKKFERYAGVVGNLILHQFPDEELKQLGEVWNRHAQFLLFNEPGRQRSALWLLRASRFLGMGAVSLYDGAVSIRAGFRGQELPELLGLNPQQWEWSVSRTILGNYRLRAQRKGST